MVPLRVTSVSLCANICQGQSGVKGTALGPIHLARVKEELLNFGIAIPGFAVYIQLAKERSRTIQNA
jgi:hypothetical protein